MNYYFFSKIIFFLILLIITKAIMVNGGLVRTVSETIKNSEVFKIVQKHRTSSVQDKNSLETLKQFENKDLELVEYEYFLEKLSEDIEKNKSKNLKNAKEELNKYKNLIRNVKNMRDEVNNKLENVKIEAARLLNKKGLKVSNKEKFVLLEMIFKYVTTRNENIKKVLN
ncbi:unnamed protein product [Meloidogyne enterolobii]|uniref:Uncharacterized protein n=1 Tax=Meloidogyne enterolobii TaxID=390850 RepID=A0ACB0ZVA7_MELEN